MIMNEEVGLLNSCLSNEASASFRDEISSPNLSADNTGQMVPDAKTNGLKALCLAIDISSNENDHMKRPLYVSPLHVFPRGDPATKQVAKTMDYPASQASFSFSNGFELDLGELALLSPKPIDEYSLSSLSPCSDDESDECFKHPYSHEEFSPASEKDDEAGSTHDSVVAIDKKPISLKTFPQILETVAKKTSTPTIHDKRVIEVDQDQEYAHQGNTDSSDLDFIEPSRKSTRKHTTKKRTTSSARRPKPRKRHPTKYTRHATLPRSKNGCWTCRCRRKKCDEARPNCRTCINLGIPCAGYSEERPDFMVDQKASLEYRREISRIIREQKIKSNEKRANSQSQTP